MTKFPYTIGIELTGIPHIPYDTSTIKCDCSDPDCKDMRVDYLRQNEDEEKIEKLIDKNNGHIHVDCHCMEVSSPILFSLKETKQFFMKTRRAMQQLKLKPHHPD